VLESSNDGAFAKLKLYSSILGKSAQPIAPAWTIPRARDRG
jgi:hypothetical protein